MPVRLSGVAISLIEALGSSKDLYSKIWSPSSRIMKFGITGVYSSAISKILVDRGYEPTRLTNTLVERLGGVGGGNEEPDVFIRDMSRWQGIILIGEQAKALADAVLEVLGGSAILYFPRVYGAVYKANVIERVRNGVIVGLDDKRGLLKTRRFEPEVELVQVTGYARSVSKLLVTDEVRVRAGDSSATRTGQPRYEHELPGGWRWRKRTTEENDAEVVKKAHDLEEMLDSPEVPEGRCIVQGKDYVEVMFGYEVKGELDRWRRKLTPTIDGHHYLKSLGPEYSALVDFAERVQPLIPDKVDGLLSETIVKGVYPRNSEEVRVFHMKPNGVDIERSPGYVLHSDEKSVVVRRSIRAPGRYDGFEAERRPGDYAISEFGVNEWYYLTVYYRRDGTEIGKYVNICTPPEISKTFIRYVDLYVDVVEHEGEARIIDKDQLDDALHSGYITQGMYQRSLGVAKRVLDEITAAKPVKSA